MNKITLILLSVGLAGFVCSSQIALPDHTPTPVAMLPEIDHERERLEIEANCYKNESKKADYNVELYVYEWIAKDLELLYEKICSSFGCNVARLMFLI